MDGGIPVPVMGGPCAPWRLWGTRQRPPFNLDAGKQRHRQKNPHPLHSLILSSTLIVMPAIPENVAAFALAAGLGDVRLAGDGLEFTVYRAKAPSHSSVDDVALRIPKCDIFRNVNDPYLSGKELLQQ